MELIILPAQATKSMTKIKKLLVSHQTIEMFLTRSLNCSHNCGVVALLGPKLIAYNWLLQIMGTALQRGWLSPPGAQRGQQEHPTGPRRPRTHSLITVKQGGHQMLIYLHSFALRLLQQTTPVASGNICAWLIREGLEEQSGRWNRVREVLVKVGKGQRKWKKIWGKRGSQVR